MLVAVFPVSGQVVEFRESFMDKLKGMRLEIDLWIAEVFVEVVSRVQYLLDLICVCWNVIANLYDHDHGVLGHEISKSLAEDNKTS